MQSGSLSFIFNCPYNFFKVRESKAPNSNEGKAVERQRRKYTVTVTAKDSKTGLTGQGTLTISISAASTTGPQISATSLSGTARMPVAGFIMISDSNASSINIASNNAPLGMMFVPSGTSIAVLWPAPVVGSYTMTIAATDSNGRSAQVSVPISVSN